MNEYERKWIEIILKAYPNLYYQNNEKTTQKQIINEENILEIEDQKQEKSKIKKIN